MQTMTVGPTGRRWAYTGVALGGAVSIAANVAHSFVPPATASTRWTPEPGAVAGAVFWPVALFVAIEILARIAWPAGNRWVVLRFGGLLPVALVAGVVSYRHLSGLLAFYSEDALAVAIGPLAVDGLMVMATGALIATGGRTMTEVVSTADVASPTPVIAPDTSENGSDIGVGQPMPVAIPERRTTRRTRETSGMASAVARMADKHPDMATAEIARRLKISDRTVRRHFADLRTVTTETSVDAAPAAA